VDDSKSQNKNNIDRQVVEDFGKEWATFNQQSLAEQDLQKAFNQYFHIFPFENINLNSVGFDMGCGSGRWAKLIANKVKVLNCIDPSAMALEQAKANLSGFSNCNFECAAALDTQLPEKSQDFGYCLGVLHHTSDTLAGLKNCSSKLKPGAPFLLYLYYRFDNRPLWFHSIWMLSDFVRKIISRLPFALKLFASQVIAAFIYWPLARLARLLEKIGLPVKNIPLSDYRNKKFYFMRTDALDRFGTKLEKRYTKNEISQMMIEAGFDHLIFSQSEPFWFVVGHKS
jgi:SAM-dependent methyltransferase